MTAILSVVEGGALLAAQAHAARSPSSRALRAYFLLSSDARRMKRAGRAAAASAIACTIQAVAFQADDLRLPRLARRAFTAVDEIVDPTGREALAGESGELAPPVDWMVALVARLNRADAFLRGVSP